MLPCGRDSVYQEEGCQAGLDYSYSDPSQTMNAV